MMSMSLVVVILIAFTVYSQVKRKLNKEGIFLANIIGLTIFVNGGFGFFMIVILVFTLTTLATNFKEELKIRKHHKRTTKNILANLGIPTILLLLGSPLLFLASISASISDTMSSEIGITSRKTPRMITTLKRAKAGVNGAVSPLGLMAGTLASLMMASITFLYFNMIFYGFLVFLAGISGTLIDSLLGALFENKGVMDGSHVNTISTLLAANIVFILSGIYESKLWLLWG